MTPAPNSSRTMRRTALACAGLALGMIGLAYASVPLYDLFCKVTGFDGTPIVRASNGSSVLGRTISVRFDANVSPGLPWRFAPETPEVNW
jgi:cytochrome c oxidase assembly protein subunit 11